MSQLKFRLSEGGGECFYYIGVEDNGHPRGLDAPELQASLAALDAMAAEVEACAAVVRTPPGAEGRRCAVVRVSGASAPCAAHDDLRVAVAGGVDSGKSTLVAVLTHGVDGRAQLDNGRGAARMNVFRHKHEIESGRTSSISHQLLAYDAQGGVLNYGRLPASTPRELAQAAARVVRLGDLGGHEKFSKTSLYGLTCTLPQYAMLCVCTSAGLSWTTLEHLAAALALGVPPFVVLTKADLAPAGRVEALAAEVAGLVAAARRSADSFHGGCGGEAWADAELAPVVRSEGHAAALAAALGERRAGRVSAGAVVVPVFAASSVTGDALPLLHAFLNALPPCDGPGAAAGHAAPPSPQAGMAARAGEPAPTQFQIDDTFDVAGVGAVVSGTALRGSVAVGARLLLGPSEGGAFTAVRVTGIQRCQVDVDRVHQGQHATLAIQPEIEAEKGGGPGEDVDVPGSPSQGAEPGGGGDAAAAAACALGASPSSPCRASAAAAGTSALARLDGRSTAADIRLPSSHKSTTSAADLQLLGRSWEFTQRLHSGGRVGGASPRPRKGTVLVDPGAAPQAVIEFEAVLVLLGGCFPPRGLLTGRFPPEGTAAAPETPRRGGRAAGSSSGSDSTPSSARAPGRSSSRPAPCTPVVHCGGVRQAAQLVWMQELELPGVGECPPHGHAVRSLALEELGGGDAVPCALEAAGVLGAWAPGGAAGAVAERCSPGALHRALSGAASAAVDDLGCVARARFRFVHRPEWMVAGTRLILRDRSSGRVAGAGLVAAVDVG